MAEIKAVLRDGMHHPRANHWRAKYVCQVVLGEVALFVPERAYEKRAPGGRHTSNKRHRDGEDTEPTTNGLLPPPGTARAIPQYREIILKRVVSLSQVPAILHQWHHAAHMGPVTLFDELNEVYYGITRDVCKGFVRRCIQCRERRVASATSPRVSLPTRPAPLVYNSLVEVDCLTLVDSRGSSRVAYAVLHTHCLASGWTNLKVLPSKVGWALRRGLWTIFMKMGAPNMIQTSGERSVKDMCRQREVKELFDESGIEYRHITSSSSNPSIERRKNVIRNTVSHLCLESCPYESYGDGSFADMVGVIQYWMNSFLTLMIDVGEDGSKRKRRISPFQYVMGIQPDPTIFHTSRLQLHTNEESIHGDTTGDSHTAVAPAAAAAAARPKEIAVPAPAPAPAPAPSAPVTGLSLASSSTVEMTIQERHEDRRAAANENHARYRMRVHQAKARRRAKMLQMRATTI